MAVALDLRSTGLDGRAPGASEPGAAWLPATEERSQRGVAGDVLWHKIRINFFDPPRFCERGPPALWAEPTGSGMGKTTYLQMTRSNVEKMLEGPRNTR